MYQHKPFVFLFYLTFYLVRKNINIVRHTFRKHSINFKIIFKNFFYNCYSLDIMDPDPYLYALSYFIINNKLFFQRKDYLYFIFFCDKLKNRLK